ncbi:hypothetical protein UFOVP793_7 [uncultured Caudovirales phage]|uniref:Uncharacterized protein n=1 Tax=uncultured Caudovirales phage TaxID=2100421 RepID=A0A6J5NY70_9CAUD|nr:hypothetical protein UFOVP793_7 [uncultured Caudovirales phage]
MFRVEHNVETGEITQIELTANEIKQITDAANAKLQNELAAEENKNAILSKLGLTADEVAALLG